MLLLLLLLILIILLFIYITQWQSMLLQDVPPALPPPSERFSDGCWCERR